MVIGPCVWRGAALAAFGVVTLLLLPTRADAIPAFARKYNLECTSCHIGATNRLNKFGREFLIRGHRTPDAEGLGKEKGDLNLLHYISVGGETQFSSTEHADPSTTSSTEVDLFSGGPLYEGFGYWFQANLSGGGVEEAYLSYNNNPGSDTYVFARAGRVTPIFVKTSGLGLGLAADDPFTLSGDFGNGNTFNPGQVATGATVGVHTAGHFVGELGVVNGGGGDDPPPTNSRGVFLSLEQRLDEEGSSIGLFGYSGRFPINDDNGVLVYNDDFTRYLAQARFEREKFTVIGGYTWGRNDLADGTTRNPRGYSAELAYTGSEKFTPFLRLEHSDPDLTSDDRLDGAALGVSWRLPNMGRFVLQFGQSRSAGTTSNSIMLDLHWAF